jgi:CheY-like chemotaxis protein
MIPTVLAVDDDRQALAFVARPDWHVIIADDRVKAISLAESVGRLDFVTADYNMPGMTRDEMVVRIRHVWPHVEVPHRTSCGPPDGRTHVSGLLTSPVTARQLHEVVVMLMSAPTQKEEPDDGDDERIDE